MVLKRLLLVALAWTLGACVHTAPAVRLATSTPTATAYVLSFPDRPDAEALPAAVATAVDETLAARNLAVRPTVADIAATFARKRSTRQRFAALTGTPHAVLVETKVRYYSLISGRYRWNVALKVTVGSPAEPERALSEEFELAAFLDYDHQDERDALVYTRDAIAERVARVVDQYLRESQAPASNDARPPPESAQSRHPLAPGGAIYFVMIDRFANGDPTNDQAVDPDDPQAFHGGDFAGLQSHLDDIRALGIDTIWLSPPFEMRDEKFHGWGAFHGYWVADFSAIEDRFGGRDALAALAAAARQRGMNILLDVVLNHVGMDTPLTREKPDWFHGRGGIVDWSDATQLLTHDVNGLPDLDQSNPEVYRYLLDNSLQWIDGLRPAGFRLDAVKHVPDEFWRRYVRDIRARAGADFVMLAEDLDGNPAALARTVEGGGFDAIFDFPLHFAMVDAFCRGQSLQKLAVVLSADRAYGDRLGAHRQGLVTLLDNHDLPRVLSQCGGRSDAVGEAMSFMLSARGTPSFTWGTEEGATGEGEPDNRKSMTFRPHPLGNTMRELLERRRSNPALSIGADRILTARDDLFAYIRTTDSQTALIVVSRGVDTAPHAPRWLSGIPFRSWDSDQASALERLPSAPGVHVLLADRVVEPPPSEKRPVEFVVVDAPTSDGAQLRIVGSGPELGNWDPTRARQPGLVEVPADLVLAAKAVLLHPDGRVEWQPGGDVFVHPAAASRVVIDWDAP